MRFRLILQLVVAALLFSTGPAFADEVKGRIMEISRKANTIQINVKDQDPVVVRFDDNTQFVEASGIGDLSGNDLVKVTFDPGKPATTIEKVVFNLPEGVEISTDELLALMTGEKPYTLIDARPKKRYVAATIPSSAHAFPKDEGFMKTVNELAPEKDGLLIFYCGGPTCPYTGEAVRAAIADGYTNVKGFQAGTPAWRKAQLPMHSQPGWLAERLDPGHVIIDTRNTVTAMRGHLPTAVTMPAASFVALTETFIAEQRDARIPGVSDRRAPIILYSDTHFAEDVLVAYRELASWGYRNITILKGGYNGWTAADLPIDTNALALAIKYVPKLAPGAIAPETFMAMSFPSETTQVLDVRSADEAASGVIAGAIHIPLDVLEDRIGELDKGKPVVVHCATGVRAEMAYRTLNKAGYDVKYLNVEMEVGPDGSFRIL